MVASSKYPTYKTTKYFRYHTETETTQTVGLQSPYTAYEKSNVVYDQMLATVQDPPPPTPLPAEPLATIPPFTQVTAPPVQNHMSHIHQDLAANAMISYVQSNIDTVFTYC